MAKNWIKPAPASAAPADLPRDDGAKGGKSAAPPARKSDDERKSARYGKKD